MGKQKVEIKVTMVDEKKKSKVMQIIAKQSGILSITADREKDKVTIVGNESMDVPCLTMVLRKQLHIHVAIDTVTQVDEKKEKEEKEKKEKEKKMKEEEENNPKVIHMPYPVHITDETSPSCCQM